MVTYDDGAFPAFSSPSGDGIDDGAFPTFNRFESPGPGPGPGPFPGGNFIFQVAIGGSIVMTKTTNLSEDEIEVDVSGYDGIQDLEFKIRRIS